MDLGTPLVLDNTVVPTPAHPTIYLAAGNDLILVVGGAFVTSASLTAGGSFIFTSDPKNMLAFDGTTLHFTYNGNLVPYHPTTLVRQATPGSQAFVNPPAYSGRGLAVTSDGVLWSHGTDTLLTKLVGGVQTSYDWASVSTDEVKDGQITSRGMTVHLCLNSNDPAVLARVLKFDANTLTFSLQPLTTPPEIAADLTVNYVHSDALLGAVPIPSGGYWASWSNGGSFFLARHAADGSVVASWNSTQFDTELGNGVFEAYAPNFFYGLDADDAGNLYFWTDCGGFTSASTGLFRASLDNTLSVVIGDFALAGLPVNGSEEFGALHVKRAPAQYEGYYRQDTQVIGLGPDHALVLMTAGIPPDYDHNCVWTTLVKRVGTGLVQLASTEVRELPDPQGYVGYEYTGGVQWDDTHALLAINFSPDDFSSPRTNGQQDVSALALVTRTGDTFTVGAPRSAARIDTAAYGYAESCDLVRISDTHMLCFLHENRDSNYDGAGTYVTRIVLVKRVGETISVVATAPFWEQGGPCGAALIGDGLVLSLSNYFNNGTIPRVYRVVGDTLTLEHTGAMVTDLPGGRTFEYRSSRVNGTFIHTFFPPRDSFGTYEAYGMASGAPGSALSSWGSDDSEYHDNSASLLPDRNRLAKATGFDMEIGLNNLRFEYIRGFDPVTAVQTTLGTSTTIFFSDTRSLAATVANGSNLNFQLNAANRAIVVAGSDYNVSCRVYRVDSANATQLIASVVWFAGTTELSTTQVGSPVTVLTNQWSGIGFGVVTAPVGATKASIKWTTTGGVSATSLAYYFDEQGIYQASDSAPRFTSPAALVEYAYGLSQIFTCLWSYDGTAITHGPYVAQTPNLIMRPGSGRAPARIARVGTKLLISGTQGTPRPAVIGAVANTKSAYTQGLASNLSGVLAEQAVISGAISPDVGDDWNYDDVSVAALSDTVGIISYTPHDTVNGGQYSAAAVARYGMAGAALEYWTTPVLRLVTLSPEVVAAAMRTRVSFDL